MRKHTSALIVALALFPLAAISWGQDAPSSTRWRQLSLSAAPSARSGPAMVYDPTTTSVILFGGYDGIRYLADTWTFDGATWTRALPLVSPPARSSAGIAYDSALGKIVLFGGFNRLGYLGDTWIWNSATHAWEPGAKNPSMRAVTSPMAFTDPANGHVDIFGGFAGKFYQLKTWQWTGTAWIELQPANSPTARSAAIAALDQNRHNVVMFGGFADVNPWNTWTWDGSDWTEVSPATQPPLLYNAAGAYDPDIQAVVVFGGGSGDVELNGTWVWNGSNWMRMHPAASPSPRESFGMAYDEATHHIVIFGGKDHRTYMNDTWELMTP